MMLFTTPSLHCLATLYRHQPSNFKLCDFSQNLSSATYECWNRKQRAPLGLERATRLIVLVGHIVQDDQRLTYTSRAMTIIILATNCQPTKISRLPKLRLSVWGTEFAHGTFLLQAAVAVFLYLRSSSWGLASNYSNM